MREHADLLDKTLPSFHTKGKTFGNVSLSPFLTEVPGCCRVCECLELRGAEQEQSPFSDLDISLAVIEGDSALGHSCQLFVYLKIHDSLSTPEGLKRIIKDEILTSHSGSYENSADVHTPLCCCCWMTPASPLGILRLSRE